MKELEDRYPVPGRTAVEREMNLLLINLKAKMAVILQSAREVAVTADVWSKKGLMSSYLGITAYSLRRRTITVTV